MSKYTPGPWEIIEQGDCDHPGYPHADADKYAHWHNIRIIGPNIEWEWEVTGSAHLGEHLANARLIATAPDLLEACKNQRIQIVTFLQSLIYQQTGNDPKLNGFAYAKIPDWALKQMVESLDVVIAKAEGKDND